MFRRGFEVTLMCVLLLACACSGEDPAGPPPEAPEPEFLARAPIDPAERDLRSGAAGGAPNPWLSGFPSGPEDTLSTGGTGPTDSGEEPGGEPPPPVEPPQLLITQYYEGTGNNKALELTNLGTQSLDLGRCRLTTYVNGATTPYRNSALSGTLAAGASVVLCSASASGSLAARCQGTSSAIAFNGNDAVLLSCDDALLDAFGRLGEDPGVAWGTTVRTIDANLLRRCGPPGPDTTPDDPFDPGTAWRAVPLTELDDLGAWTCPDAAEPVEPPLPEGFEPLPDVQNAICQEEELLKLR
jgi:hypothetical protein